MKKFDVSFPAPTSLDPSFVFVSPSEGYPGHFSVGVLYPRSKVGTFNSPAGISRTFDLKQYLCPTEADAIAWATTWLSAQAQLTATLTPI